MSVLKAVRVRRWSLPVLFFATAMSISAEVRYVDVNSANPVAPYTNWATASRTLQSAVSLSVAGDRVIVTNGVYRSGGRTWRGANRVALMTAVTVESVNGPAVTIIEGFQMSGTTNGITAIRCAYLTNGAVLAGFTLTNGATKTDGDHSTQTGGGVWCESIEAVVSNCVLTGNSAYTYGGGAYFGTLKDCKLDGNSAVYGGGAYSSTLSNCTLRANSGYYGGAAYVSSLHDCTLWANSATYGGGASESFLARCRIFGNSAYSGGGTLGGTLHSCSLAGNSAENGGGAYNGVLRNCTITGNSAYFGGGLHDGSANNCIVYYNVARNTGNNYWNAYLDHCATTPLPQNGNENITAEPQLADFAHVSAGSPCRGAGNAASSSLDLDQEPWLPAPSIGCDEYRSGGITGPLNVSIRPGMTNAVTGFNVNFVGHIDGHASSNRWDFGDGTGATNLPYATHAWAAPGDYLVTFSAYNETYPAGVSATFIVHIIEAPVHYVAVSSPSPVAPYTSWGTAARSIQDAIDSASIPGAIVLVSNGVYSLGGRLVDAVSGSNRIAVTKAVTVRSVNGPAVTTIRGLRTTDMNAMRCAYLTNGAKLIGLTLTNGGAESQGAAVWSHPGAVISNCVLSGSSAGWEGGGAYRGTLRNCTLLGNLAPRGGGACEATLEDCALSRNSAEWFSSGYGGGAYGGILNRCSLSGNSADYGGGASGAELINCILSGNSASSGGGSQGGTLMNCVVAANSAVSGGGVFYSSLNHCTITGNSAQYGGGLYSDYWPVNNCILYYNHATYAGDNHFGSAPLNFCCTTPLPFNGTNNIATEPQLASQSHLSIASPCRAAGFVTVGSIVDIDGEPWAVPPSIGCDEVYPGGEVGPLTVSIRASYTNVAAGFEVNFAGTINGHAASSRWEFGDGSVLSNRPYAAYRWAVPGNYPVVLRAYNASNPDGVTATVIIRVEQVERYVAPSGSTPVSPYLTWATAANNIQAAVNAAPPGAVVLVTNGVYQISGRTAHGGNRVALVRPMTVRSINGPAVTEIRGSQAGIMTRCAYLTNGATLAGFTLASGATRTGGTYLEQSGGGVLCESTNALVVDCVLRGNTAVGNGGGAFSGTLRNCVVTGNASGYGGGVSDSTVQDCTVSGNRAEWAGGGANRGSLLHCTISGNFAQWGAGVYAVLATNCMITLNVSTNGSGAGAYSSTLFNCTVSGNSARDSGGGAFLSTLANCAITGNSAREGGGVYLDYYQTLNNCTVTGNAARNQGGGVFGGTANNCILYYNTAGYGANYAAATVNFSCTTPMPNSGSGNLIAEPQLADASHLSESSPCRGAGDASFAIGADIDGEPWGVPPSIGCDEYFAGSITGAITATIQANYTNVAPGVPVQFTARITGHASASQWEFDDGTVTLNQIYTSRVWDVVGDYLVTLRVFNEENPAGVIATIMIHVVEPPVHHVDIASPGPVPPYTSWDAAARTIQEAVDASSIPGAIILVTNGIYRTGGRAVSAEGPQGLNRVVVTKPVVLQSVNGAAFTIIEGNRNAGAQAVRCVYLGNGAVLMGFTLTNGTGGVVCESTNALLSKCVIRSNSVVGAQSGTLDRCTLKENRGTYGGGANSGVLNSCTLSENFAQYGGGAYLSLLNNCTLIGNAALYEGGGAYASTLNNCSVSGNSASDDPAGFSGRGGGTFGGTLNNCTLTGNSARQGGGSCQGTLNNCVVYYNNAALEPNHSGGTLDHCCTTPLPATGANNITAEPQLADFSHLSASSPCRGAGSASYTSGFDVDGEDWADPPSIGCDEYYPGEFSGHLAVTIQASYVKVATGFDVNFVALIEGKAAFSRWDFGDGTIVNNRPYVSHHWSTPGDYTVVLQVFSESVPLGVAASVRIDVVDAPIHYVALNSATPVAPFTSWATAATNIQDAVNASTLPGALVLVTNGTYKTGAQRVGSLAGSNRVAVVAPVTVRSVNGPAVTIIEGLRSYDINAVRCAYLTNQAALIGFTLANGGSDAYYTGINGGGAWCRSASAVLSNCVIVANAGYAYGAGVYGGTLKNCIVASNAFSYGGAVYGATLHDSVLIGNSGTAASYSLLEQCSVQGNFGSGAEYSSLSDCSITDHSGTGAAFSVLNNCILRRNGVGATQSKLDNCAITANDGGVDSSTLAHCTITGNLGTGASYSTLNNCLVYYNQAGNYEESTFNYSCTTPLPASGAGNIDTEPQLADFMHISAASPCRGAGNPGTTAGFDIDGERWANPPSIGCDEFRAAGIRGPLSISLQGDYTNIAAGVEVSFTSVIEGHAASNRWDFGDGTTLNNRIFASHAWTESGTYTVELRVYNSTHPAGVSATAVVNVLVEPIHYVNFQSTNPVPPYTSWATAASKTQDAVDVAYIRSTVLVTNGVYAPVTIDAPIALRSVNGAAATLIDGAQSDTCVSLASGASLAGFTLRNGTGDYGGGVLCAETNLVSDCVFIRNSAQYGGGAYYASLNNCTFIGNSAQGDGGATYLSILTGCTLATNSAQGSGGGAAGGELRRCLLVANTAVNGSGGGASFATLVNCAVFNNSATNGWGGGVYECALTNCTVIGNSAQSAGGSYSSGASIANCILYYNRSANASDNHLGVALAYCCTTPSRDDSVGIITNAPALVNVAGRDLRLQPSSPCINSGHNASAPSETDLDGSPRVRGGTVDIGAYEFQSPGSIISYAWLQQYGLPLDGTADHLDSDGDRLSNWQEWRVGTSPSDAASLLRVLSLSRSPAGVTITWQSVSGVTYFIDRSISLTDIPAFITTVPAVTGDSETTSYTDAEAPATGPLFYRIGVQQ